MSLEKKIEKKTCEYAQKHGFLTPKFTVVSERGWPDRLFIDPEGWCVFIEFKQKGNELAPIQVYRCMKLTERNMTVLVIDSIEQGIEYVDNLVAARVSEESDTDAPFPGERRIIS